MLTRASAIRRGKASDTQLFSLARPERPSAAQAILETVKGTVSVSRRHQILYDVTSCPQFACVFGDTVGFLTRPVVLDREGEEPVVCGSFSDTIGETIPVMLNLESFQGRFTTLISRRDATQFALPVHPTDPDGVPGPGIPGRGRRAAVDPEPASLERLAFPMPEEDEEGDRPVIAALPQFMPIPPGATFTHSIPLSMDGTFTSGSTLLDVWFKGVAYAKVRNEGFSVTAGGPLFDQTQLGVEGNDPFESLDILVRVHDSPTMLIPTSALFGQVVVQVRTYADDIWYELGTREPPASVGDQPPAQVGGSWSPDDVKTVVTQIVNSKEKKFRNAARSAARYRILLASGGEDPEHQSGKVAKLPELLPSFTKYLSEANNATAADDLKELVRAHSFMAARSRVSDHKDVTFDADCITCAFSDRTRSTLWLGQPLHLTTKKGARDKLCLLHFLTPDRVSLANVADSDSQAKAITLANSSDSTAQLDASKSSQLYAGGKLTTMRHCYECGLNLIHFFGVMVGEVGDSMLVTCITDYLDVLTSKEGQLFFEAHTRANPHLPVQVWQEMQLIFSRFLDVSMNCDVYQAVMDGRPIGLENYKTALAVAEQCTTELRTIVNGNGLGKFTGTPMCASWFSNGFSSSGAATDRARDEQTPAKKQRVVSVEDIERRKAAGSLTYDKTAGGSAKLPDLPVYHKRRGAKNSEKLCMAYMTVGYHCSDPRCKRPHVSNLAILTEASRTKLAEAVATSPGYKWVPGREPPGTS